MRGHRQLVLSAAIFLCFAQNAWAQELVHRVGFLAITEVPEVQNAFIDGLRERGYVVGRNLQLDFRYTQGEAERIPALINELVALHPEIIVTVGPPNAIAVHYSAPAIPLVFLGIGDPVAVGLVESLAHPGGDV